MKHNAINFKDKFTKFTEHWSPRVIAEMNDYQFKLVKVEGEFVWHDHPDTDEVFIVIEGCLNIEFRDGVVTLYPSHLKMQDSASRERVSTKALIEENGCSIVEINNAGDDPLSPCPKGAKLENHLRVAYTDVCT